jgi:hypothetical protein
MGILQTKDTNSKIKEIQEYYTVGKHYNDPRTTKIISIRLWRGEDFGEQKYRRSGINERDQCIRWSVVQEVVA